MARRHKRSAGYDPGRPLVQTHVPKSGGNSLQSSLERALDKPAYVTWDRSTFGAFEAFDTIEPAKRAQMVGVPAGIDRLPDDLEWVSGHVSATTTFAQLPAAQHLLVLREPRSRLLSHWAYWRTRPPRHMASWGEWGAAAVRSVRTFESFLADDSVLAQTDNVATRMLLWGHRRLPDAARIPRGADRKLGRAALRVLDTYTYIDVLENPDWAQNLGQWLGVAFTSTPENDTPASDGPDGIELSKHLTPRAMNLLESATRLDAALWRNVARMVMPEESLPAIADAAFAATIARHAVLFSGRTAASPLPQ